MTFFLVRAQCALVATALLAAAPATLAAQPRTGSAPAPATLWAAQNTPRELTLVWDSVAGAKSFRLYRGSGESAQVIARPEARVLRWVVPVTAAMVGAPQQFAIEAIDAAGLPSPRASFNAVTPIAVTPGGGPVAAPATVTVSEGADGVTLTWDAVPGATAYAIGRSVRPGGLRPLCALCSTQTTYVDRNPTAGAVHVYSVTAVTPRGTSRATRSNELTPSGGGGIVAVGGGTGGSTGGSGGTGSTGGTGGGTTGGSDSTGGTGGTGGTTTATAPPPPPTGIALRVSGIVQTGIEATWQGGAGAESFRISRALCYRPPQEVATVPQGAAGTSRPWLDTIPPATIRNLCQADFFGMRTVDVMYTVTAVNSAGASPPAASPHVTFRISSTTLDALMGTGTTTAAVAAPTPLSATASGPTSVSLNWQSSPGAESYVLSRSVCNTPPELARTVPITVGAPNMMVVDDVDWAKINATCPVGFTTATVVYSVAARNASGMSVPANFPRVTLALDQTVYGTTPPGAVSGARASFTNDDETFLMWSRPAAATSYRIERALGAKGAFQYLATVQGSAWSFRDATKGIRTMSPAYRITATNPNGSAAGVVVAP